MKLNKILAAGLVVAMVSSVLTIPSFAKVTSNPGNGLVYTDNNNINYPCWIWLNGACYYYQNPGTVLKNTTTPDGFTVDADGRWVINGVVQSNGYGSYKMGTEDYNGKTDDEIWNLMFNKLEAVYANSIANTVSGLTYSYDAANKDEIAFEPGEAGTYGNDITISHNNEYKRAFIYATIGAAWSDQANNVATAYSKASYAQKADVKEKTIKALVGDTVGQELFDYIRAHADKTAGGYITYLDESGNPVHGWYETILDDNGYVVGEIFHENPTNQEYKTVWSETCGNGMGMDTLDWSMWQNRITDYGKTFSVGVVDGYFRIIIY